MKAHIEGTFINKKEEKAMRKLWPPFMHPEATPEELWDEAKNLLNKEATNESSY